MTIVRGPRFGWAVARRLACPPLAAATGLAGALLLAPAAAQAAPGPDIKVEKSCQLDPSKGPTAIVCVINVTNIGSVPSVSPITITDTPGGPAGTTFTSGSGSFGCSTPTGPLPASIACSGPHSLAIGGNTGTSGSSGSTFLYFKLPAAGGTFRNCAKVTQGQNAATLPDPDLSNNNSCASITVKGAGGGGGPPDVSVGKECTLGANRSVTCAIKVTNNGATPTATPLSLVDTIGPTIPGISLTGASGNVSCPGPGPYAQPIACTVTSPIPGGQSITVLLAFTVKGKGTFQNCAKVGQGGAAAEANLGNNSSCAKVTMP